MTNAQLNLAGSLKQLAPKEVGLPRIDLSRFHCDNQFHMHVQIRSTLDAIGITKPIAIEQKEPLITQFKPLNKSHFKLSKSIDELPEPEPTKTIDKRPVFQFKLDQYEELKKQFNIKQPKQSESKPERVVPIIVKPQGLSISPKEVMNKRKAFKTVNKIYFKSMLNFEQTKVLKDLSTHTPTNINPNVITKLTSRGFALFNNNKYSITAKGLDYLENVAI